MFKLLLIDWRIVTWRWRTGWIGVAATALATIRGAAYKILQQTALSLNRKTNLTEKIHDCISHHWIKCPVEVTDIRLFEQDLNEYASYDLFVLWTQTLSKVKRSFSIRTERRSTFFPFYSPHIAYLFEMPCYWPLRPLDFAVRSCWRILVTRNELTLLLHFVYVSSV